jgi:hypothetical protein
VSGESHGKSPFSRLHSKLEPGSLEAKVKLGVGSSVVPPSPGPETMRATGGAVSAVKAVNASRAGFGVRS